MEQGEEDGFLFLCILSSHSELTVRYYDSLTLVMLEMREDPIVSL
jgi:hypothetical protein